MDLKVLAIDIGGTNVKIRVASDPQQRSFPSGPTLTPHQMVDGVLELAQGWEFDAVSIGLPAPIVKNKPMHDPGNLGQGWVDFNYAARFAKQVKLINDAAMQAVGSYEGGRMLFLGFGTGLGSCLIAEHVIVPTEIAHMPYREGGTFEDAVGIKAFEKHRKKHWTKDVYAVIEILSAALIPDYIVLGGGNAAKLQEIPPNCRLGDNAHAFTGGFRMWTPEWAHLVYVRSRTLPSPGCPHGRHAYCVSRAAVSASARRARGVPPLRASPPREDAALPDRVGGPRGLARGSLGPRAPRRGLHRRGVSPVSHVRAALLRIRPRALAHGARSGSSSPSRASGGACARHVTLGTWHRLPRISSTTSSRRCPCGSG